jgi:iron(III) transport system permease protein
MSIAFILLFMRPLPVLNVSALRHAGIILIAYVSVFLAVGLKSVTAAYVQIDDSAGGCRKGGRRRFLPRMLRIYAPLAAPARRPPARSWCFLTAYNEVTVSALLWSTGNETIGTTIFNYEDGGYTTLAAAMASVTVFATVLVMLAVNGLARHVPPGTIPWRD